MEDEEDLFNDETLRKTLMGKKKNKVTKIIIFLVALNLILIGLVTYGIINLYDKDEKDENEENEEK